jgi:O-succinylbenzoic acid--CoA ligase
LDAAVSGAARRLADAGIREGDRIALMLPLTPGYPILMLALMRLGAVACPINPRFPEAYRNEVLDRIRCDNLIVLEETDASPSSSSRRVLLAEALTDDSLEESGPLHMPEDRPATLILTSGSSGTPKAAVLSFGNLYHNALNSNRNIVVDSAARWLFSLGLHHVAGLGILFRCLLGGGTMIMPTPGAALKESIVRRGVTHLSLVATQLHRLMEDAEAVDALRAMRAILLGGGPIPETLIRRAHANGLPIFTSYGLTEMATQAATSAPGDSLEHLLTSGRPLARDALRIAEDGEIWVGGKTLFLGYWEDGAIHDARRDDGCFATGDLGALDADGYLRVVGRKDNMFIAGGENVQPEEIEDALCRIDGVVQAVVVPVEHEAFGATPIAFVRMAESFTLDPDVLSGQLASILPKFKIPRCYLAWPDEPGFSEGKIPRKTFKTLAQEKVCSATKAPQRP